MMRPRAVRAVVSLVILVLAAASPAAAIGLRDPADRNYAEPLRSLNIATVLDGQAPAWGPLEEAWERLPERCKDPAALTAADPCDEDLRCVWLAARYRVARAWVRGDARARLAASRRIHDAASALVAGLRCADDERADDAFERDAGRAAADDGLVQVALLATMDDAGGPVLEAEADRVVADLVARARRQGVGSISARDAAARRSWLYAARERRGWLAAQPVLARLRGALFDLWEPYGGVPERCAERLVRPDVLSDAWRGTVVREGVPSAMICLSERLPRAMRASGQRPRAKSLDDVVDDLRALARNDPGGRRFGKDRVALRRVATLVEGLAPRSEAEQRAAEPRSAQSAKRARSEKDESSGPRGGKRVERASRKTRARATRPRARGAADEALVALARRVGNAVGGRDRLLDAARTARSVEARARVLDDLLVSSHRALCAPLERIHPADVGAARAVLTANGVALDETACLSASGRAGVETLLAAAEGLRRLRWAAYLRGTARRIALGELASAKRELDALPSGYRGVTYAVLRAWLARRDGDPVAASRALARIDAETLARLRASGDEAVARVVAHAWSSTR